MLLRVWTPRVVIPCEACRNRIISSMSSLFRNTCIVKWHNWGGSPFVWWMSFIKQFNWDYCSKSFLNSFEIRGWFIKSFTKTAGGPYVSLVICLICEHLYHSYYFQVLQNILVAHTTMTVHWIILVIIINYCKNTEEKVNIS